MQVVIDYIGYEIQCLFWCGIVGYVQLVGGDGQCYFLFDMVLFLIVFDYMCCQIGYLFDGQFYELDIGVGFQFFDGFVDQYGQVQGICFV